MRYHLIDQPRGTVFQPIVKTPQDLYTIENQGASHKVNIKPNTINAADTSYRFYFADSSGINVSGAGSGKNLAQSSNKLPQIQNQKQPAEFVGPHIDVTGKPSSVDFKVTVKITGEQTGMVKYVDINVNKNIQDTVGTRLNAKTRP